MKRFGASIAAAILVLFSACAPADTEPGVVTAEGAEAVPSRTATDWVTYGDHLVVIDVKSEERLEATKEEVERGEGFIGREVTVELGDPLWTRPTYQELSELPTRLAIANGGWVFHGKEEQRWEVENQVRLTPGSQYLAMLTYGDTSIAGGDGSDGPSWFTLDVVPLTTDDTVADTGADPASYPMRRSLVGLTSKEVAATLKATKPDPAAQDYMDEDPVQRYQDVARDADATNPPEPGPGEKR